MEEDQFMARNGEASRFFEPRAATDATRRELVASAPSRTATASSNGKADYGIKNLTRMIDDR